MKKHNGMINIFLPFPTYKKIETKQHFHGYKSVSKNENKEELWFLDSQEKLSVCLDL